MSALRTSQVIKTYKNNDGKTLTVTTETVLGDTDVNGDYLIPAGAENLEIDVKIDVAGLLSFALAATKVNGATGTPGTLTVNTNTNTGTASGDDQYLIT